MAVDNPRPEKVALVEEIRGHLDTAEAVVLTEYRGLDVPQQAQLRAAVRAAGGQVKIYKNTLARRTADEAGLEIGDLLVGPTAIAFVGPGEDGAPGDPVALAKALQDFADDHEVFVVKGGIMDGAPVDTDGVKALSKVPPRDVMLGQLAGLIAAPMAKFASLLQAPMQNLAGLIKALHDDGGASDAPAAEAAPADAADDAAGDAADEPVVEAAEETDAAPDEASAADDAAEETDAAEPAAEDDAAPEAADEGE